MAKNTTLKTRIQNRHDTETNWTTASNATNPFVPLKGELIVYDPDPTNTSPRIKIGDGSTKVGELTFIGDTSDCAKKSDLSDYVSLTGDQTIAGTKTFTSTVRAKEIIHTEGYVNTLGGIIFDNMGYGAQLRLKGQPDNTSIEAKIGIILQNKSGTVALLSDIPDTSNLVTTNTAQTISGVKTFTDAIQLQGVGIAAKVGGENSSYTNILKGSGNVVEVGSTSYLTRIYSNGRISVYDYSTSPSTSEKVAYQSEIPTNYVTTDTEQIISAGKAFTTQSVSDIASITKGVYIDPEGAVTCTSNGESTAIGNGRVVAEDYGVFYFDLDHDSFTIGTGLSSANIKLIGADGTININGQGITRNYGSGITATYLTDKDLELKPSTIKETVVTSSWATTSAAIDTQFGKYYVDITIPNKSITSVRTYSTLNTTGLTLDYAPEIKCNNRRISDTVVRFYSNTTFEGKIVITLMGDSLPGDIVKNTSTISSWTTSSAAVDTQLGKYYSDITISEGDLLSVRVISASGLTTAPSDAYCPEVWADNRKTNATTLRIYSNTNSGNATVTTVVMSN